MQLVSFFHNHILEQTIRLFGKLTYCLGTKRLAVET
jgi:hypothetical protein